MKNILYILISILSIAPCLAQDLRTDFAKYLQESDTVKLAETLSKWEQESPKDPELFTCYFNYYYTKSKQEITTLTKENLDGKGIALEDSLGAIAGYMHSQISFDDKMAKKALDKIDEGIMLYPNRLDMRFGKIYFLGQMKDWEKFTNTIIEAVHYSKVNENHWEWTNNEKTSGESWFLSLIQNYQATLYEENPEQLFGYMKRMADEILKIYPNHIATLSNLAVFYSTFNELDRALEYLNCAEKIDPNNILIVTNIAHAYSLKKENAKAIEYYEKLQKIGDEADIDFAKQKIEELKD